MYDHEYPAPKDISQEDWNRMVAASLRLIAQAKKAADESLRAAIEKTLGAENERDND